ncbi:MAG TPA: flagellar basal body-associated FliL family protein [Planctomycetes bacterium]|nr:flagellar basal body-associated FliL family protein [Planctomycetota bacterium]HIJ71814.1 flagellar basal body-associated FliL family protein [Planctomycetota bacterium]
MADEEEKKAQETTEQPQAEQEQNTRDKGGKASGLKLFTWLILVAVVAAGFAGGFALAQLLAGSETPSSTEAEQNRDDVNTENNSAGDLLIDKPTDEKLWSFELEPVIANLDEPGVTRYARVTITLQLSPQMDQEKGSLFLEEKKAILRDWLTTYIAGLNLERVRGTSNLGRIKKELRDSFNELLFPQSKPFINNILFKEFAVQ